MSDLLSNDDLFSLTENVWVNILGLDLVRDSNDDGKIGDDGIVASVQITGEWEGAILVACPRSLGMVLASQMLGMEPDEIDDEMLRDAMGEIANMTGGSVKGVIPGSNTLTLPTVAEGAPDSMSIAKTRMINCFTATCETQSVVVTVMVKEG